MGGLGATFDDKTFFAKVISVDTFEVYTDLDLEIPLDTSAVVPSFTTGGEIGIRYQEAEDQFFDSGNVEITNIVLNNPIRVTTDTEHNLLNGDLITISGVDGTTELNTNQYYVNRVNNFSVDLYTDSARTIPVNGTVGFTTYIGEGLVTRSTDADSTAITAIGDKYDLVNTIIENGIESGAEVVYGSTYKLVITNGASSYTDQTNPNNTDALPGKVIRGKESEALGIIVSFTNNSTADAGTDPVTGLSEPNPTIFQLHLLNAKDFEPGEPLEYGNFVRKKQVVIRVEAGIYEEDYPIRLESNVSLKGDEFRRVIIKPKTEKESRIPRISQSKWAQLYFYRDNEFDGLTLATEGTPFLNQDGQFQGRFGYHYLDRADRPINIGPTVTNAGNFTTASSIISNNKDYIIEETIQFLTDRFPALVYEQAKCRRDTRLIVEAIATDLANGGEENTLEVQGSYQSLLANGDYLTQLGDSTQEVATEAAIDNISALASDLLSGSAPNYTDGSYTAGSASVIAVEAPDITLGAGESGTASVVGQLISKINFVFDVEYNPPKRNDDLDMFLMGDATIVRNVSCQGHGGFMCVLDPEGQVLTKSPYIQTASSFSKSINKQIFAGGMYVDAYVGNLPTRIIAKTNAFQLDVQSSAGEGLRLRPPQLPCPFYVEGRRYQVNAISDYDKGQGTATLYLDANSNSGVGYDETQFDDGLAIRNIFLQTAGNRSMLANDFTQVNDLGYGLVTNNAAFSEQVSTFTYYCHTAMYANNGSEIRGLNCSNGYGNFGLVAEGADPNEIPDQTTLDHNMTQPGKAYTDATFTNAFDDASVYIYDLANPPTSQSVVTIDHGGAVGELQYRISAVQNMSDLDGDGIIGETGDAVATGIKTVDNSSVIGSVPAGTTSFTGVEQKGTTGSGAGAEFSVALSGGVATFTVSRVGLGYSAGDTISISGADIGGADGPNDLSIDVDTVFGTTAGTVSNVIYKLDLSADDVSKEDFFGTLQDTVPNNTIITFRDAFNLEFAGVNSPEDLVTRPSTAINFDESDGTTYRSISFQTTDSFSQDLPANNVQATVEAEYDYVQLDISTTNLSGGYGSAQGDTKLAVNALVSGGESLFTDAIRITRDSSTQAGKQPGDAGYDSGMMFTWDGKSHKITDYSAVTVLTLTGSVSVTAGETITQANTGATGTVLETVTANIIELTDVSSVAFNTDDVLTGSSSGALGANSEPASVSVDNWAFIEFSDIAGTNINSSYGGSGLNSAVPAAERTIQAGLQAGSTSEITVSISLLRATGHDFTQIGTGSFNDSNYPNVILGQPVNALADFYTDSETASSAQVWERRKGRVFFVSTDQDGFFRVGKFFSVDQATGDITFAGEIGLSNANSLGFKKGVTINEFSADDSFADESGQAVPTEKAAGNYINRVLGYNVKALAQIPGSSNRIGPGFLALNGDSPMEGDLDMNSNNIQNVSVPSSGTDVTNKNYVDSNVNNFASFSQMRDNSLINPAEDDLMVVTGKKIIYVAQETGTQAPFVAGDGIRNQSGTATGTIVSISNYNDEQFGSIRKVVYTPVSGTFNMDADNIVHTSLDKQANGVSSSLVTDVGGPYDEFASATEANTSDINLTVARTSSDVTIDLAIASDSIINADVNSAAAIAQSKLAMNTAGTRANASGISQSDLGLATFKNTEFTHTNGFVELQTSSSTSTGVAPAKLQHVATDTVLGRSAAGDGAVSAISFDTVLDQGGALRDSEFPAYVSGTDVLLRTAAGTYTVKDLSDASTADTVVLRKTAATGIKAGAVQAEALILGGNATYEVLSLSGTTLQIKTPGQATILEAVGTDSNSLVTDFNGIINVGQPYPDPTAGSPVLVSSESTAQTNTGTPASGGRAGKGFTATNWVYTKAIEALDEGANGGSNSTGIAFGANVGFTEGGASTVLTFVNGTATARVNTSGLQVDTISALTTNTNLKLSGAGTGIVEVNDDLYLNDGNIIYEGTDNNFETTLSFINPGADHTISIPNATGTIAVSVSDTTTTTQGDLNLDLSLNAAGQLSATGDAHGLATGDSPSFAGLTMTGNILPDNTSNNRNVGSSSQKFNTVYASVFDGTATSAQYADLAEMYVADSEYEPGTVLVFGGQHEVTVTTNKNDIRVAGIVSTDPAYLMNSQQQGDNVVAVALTGRVPCKVIGQVRKGDMLVTSAIQGYAIVNNTPGVGTVIGKAVGAKDDEGKGTVEVVVGRV